MRSTGASVYRQRNGTRSAAKYLERGEQGCAAAALWWLGGGAVPQLNARHPGGLPEPTATARARVFVLDVHKGHADVGP